MCSFFLDAEYKENDVKILAAISVKGKYKDNENIKFKTLPVTCLMKV